MVQINAVRTWGAAEITVTEGTVIAGCGNCAWCDQPAVAGEFVLIVEEDGRAAKLVVHPKCLPPGVKAARAFALGFAQVLHNHAPQRG